VNWPLLITLVLYFVILAAIGLRFCRKNETIEGYLLGSRGLGAWVTAFSTQASDMSGWLLMALPGTVYLNGLPDAWIALGLIAGTYLNWRFVAARLRVYTEKTGTLTLPCFFESRFRDPTGLIRVLSAVLILIFFTIYTSSGMVSAGKLLDSIFDGMGYTWAVFLGGGIVIAYTLLGGYLAVCWTDLFQGILMVFAVVIIPVLAFRQVGGVEGIDRAMATKGLSTTLIPTGVPWPLLAVCSSMAWGLGYFGQPHILVRFMSVRSLQKLRQSRRIAMAWVVVSLAGAVVIGLIAIALFEQLPKGEEERVCIYMIRQVVGPWLQGVLFAAILAAIMSTIDSQLLVSASALSEDLYRKVLHRTPTPGQVVWISRTSVMVISVIAVILALPKDSRILKIVAYAWGGFGASLGPVVLFALFSRRTTWVSALAGMITGAGVLWVWKAVGLGEQLYEIVPGFFANGLVIWVVNRVHGQQDPQILRRHEEVVAMADRRAVS